MIHVRIVNRSGNPLPAYGTDFSAGMDLRACLEGPRVIRPMERVLVPTGLFIELPEGFEAQIRPRSGMALKYGITVLNSPGTIDADYRGEIGIILINLSGEDFLVNNGDRICQMVIGRVETIAWKEAVSLENTDRGEGGFGHTGKE
jgi:dUTP pyrophosphatase